MKRRYLEFLAFAIAALMLALPAAAQNADQGKVQQAGTAKYGSLPVLPSCATFAVERGDPTSGPSVLLIRATSGCVVPWHWHTANEELLIVSGNGKIEMEGQGSQPLSKGSYAFLPAKHHHQFTCQAQCLFFDNVAGTFDIHYVDKSGNEIPVAQALQAVKEKPGSGK